MPDTEGQKERGQTYGTKSKQTIKKGNRFFKNKSACGIPDIKSKSILVLAYGRSSNSETINLLPPIFYFTST